MRKKLFTIVLTVFLIQIGSQVKAQETKYYALFISKFAEYIHWTEKKTDHPITIGVVGQSDIQLALNQIASAKSGKLKIIEVNTSQEASTCHLLFLPKEQTAQFKSLNNSLKTHDVVLVTEKEGYAERGAGISFYTEGTKLRFKMNQSVIESKKIKLSKSLLVLATVI